MRSLDAQQVTIEVDDAHRVSGLLLTPERARACYVLAHGAGAGMAHPFMAAVAEGLAQRAIGLHHSRVVLDVGLCSSAGFAAEHFAIIEVRFAAQPVRGDVLVFDIAANEFNPTAFAIGLAIPAASPKRSPSHRCRKFLAVMSAEAGHAAIRSSSA